MTTGFVQEQNLEKQIEKQMGCMAGFLQIFDRHHLLTGKRIYSTKRLPSTPAVDSAVESENSVESSPAVSRELEKPQNQHHHHEGRSMPSPDRFKQSPVSELRSPAQDPTTTPVEMQSKLTLPFPVFEFKEGTRASWKFCKEAPRLSLDSRAVVDAKGSLKPREIRSNAAILSSNRSENNEEGVDDNEKRRRSTSVIARLMGLEPLPNSDPEPAKRAELRRSASESRVSKDFHQYRFIDGVNFQLKQSQSLAANSQSNNSSNGISQNNNAGREERAVNGRQVDPKQFTVRNIRGEAAKAPQRRGGIGPRKSFFDSADFFPEPKQTVSIYGEIEKRLKMRRIDEPSKDLETLKQVLEALQLKGLLHQKKPSAAQANLRNFVYDESPIVVMKPGANRQGRVGSNSYPSSVRSRPEPRRNLNFSGAMSPAVSPRRDRREFELNMRNQSQSRGRNSISPTRSDTGVKSPSRRRPLSVETQRKSNNESMEQGRGSYNINMRRTVSDQTPNRSPRMTKPAAEIRQKNEAEDEISTVSECSMSTSSQTDTERSKAEEYREGRSLLERCDKLLHNIAEITASELQPSPVSVLDSSFYKEESSPSPVMKRSIDFKELQIESEDDLWCPAISSVESKSVGNSDFVYISDILCALNYLPEDSDVFLLLEKQQYLKGKDASKVSTLERKLIFDTIGEILNRRRQLPPWKVISYTNSNSRHSSLQQIWSEFQKLRERDSSEDLFNAICGVLRKDLAGDAINGDCPIEMSEAVLDIERLIFKDLISETIRDLAAFSGNCNPVPVLRRKLIF
ncbi:protein LONGIFOLIA 1 [Mangifera indica]|uniref:protein LONGIFOLIA 1 n=1 Tax=Mangifera indica TaxID=29780 RepID=UPI001CFB6403|nr:protein LONGIFOLIA 1 [Mangifera indica]